MRRAPASSPRFATISWCLSNQRARVPQPCKNVAPQASISEPSNTTTNSAESTCCAYNRFAPDASGDSRTTAHASRVHAVRDATDACGTAPAARAFAASSASIARRPASITPRGSAVPAVSRTRSLTPLTISITRNRNHGTAPPAPIDCATVRDNYNVARGSLHKQRPGMRRCAAGCFAEIQKLQV